MQVFFAKKHTSREVSIREGLMDYMSSSPRVLVLRSNLKEGNWLLVLVPNKGLLVLDTNMKLHVLVP